MAQVIMEGFELGHCLDCVSYSGVSVVATTGLDMDGDYCLDATGLTDYWHVDIDDDYSELYVSGRVNVPSLVSTVSPIVFKQTDSTTTASIKITTAGAIAAYVGGLTVVATTSPLISTGVTNCIEVYYKKADSGGRIVVKLNNIMVIDYTGDTKIAGDGSFISNIWFGYGVYLDNIIVDSSGWIGKLNIEGIMPSGAGTTTQMTPSTGDNYDCVNNVPYSPTGPYVYTNTVGHIDTYATGNLTGDIGTIESVKVSAIVESVGAPTPTNINITVRSDGTDYYSSDIAIPSTDTCVSQILEVDPATTAAWLEAAVNNIELGQRTAA